MLDIINNMSMKSKLLLMSFIGAGAFIVSLVVGLAIGGLVFVIVTIIGACIWLAVTVATMVSLTGPVERLTKAAQAMADGNLNINFRRALQGELGLLEDSMANLTGTMQKITDESDTLLQQYEEAENERTKAVSEGERLQSQFGTLLSDITNLVNSASSGRLDQRIEMTSYQGDLYQVASSLNKFVEAVATPVQEVISVMEQTAHGDFSRRITGTYSGDFERIKDCINRTTVNTSGCIKEIARILTELAGKNLNVSVAGDFIGDFSEIKDDLELIISQFNEVLNNISSVAEQVAMGAKTISDSSMSLAEGANMQAATVDSLTDTITQVDDKTASNAENATRAEKLSGESHDNAVKGNAEMQKMLESMEAIKDSSSNISTIIRVISDIAFQTEMLALNAAVEAARAAEHGRGFAVVAEEVRNLATKSDEAAKETTELINESIEKVNQGTEIAEATAQALVKIVSDTDEVSGIISGIALESHEQSEAIGRVNRGTGEIAEVIQRNSSTSEETAAAAQELSSQSEVLRDMITVFRLRGGSMRSSSGYSRQPQASVSATASTPPVTATTPKPAATTPKPAATTPKPAVVTPKPTAAAPEPTTPKPAVATAKPAATAPKPSVVTPKPDTTAPKPAVATPKPAVATPKPAVATPKPAVATPAIKSTLDNVSAPDSADESKEITENADNVNVLEQTTEVQSESTSEAQSESISEAHSESISETVEIKSTATVSEPTMPAPKPTTPAAQSPGTSAPALKPTTPAAQPLRTSATTPKPATLKPATLKPATSKLSSGMDDLSHKTDDLAAAYVAESRKMVRANETNDTSKNDRPSPSDDARRESRPTESRKLPDFTQGLVNTNTQTVKAPSAANVYDKKDYGKY